MSVGLSRMIGQKVIVRSNFGDIWFGYLSEKSGSEVILSNARRLCVWDGAEGGGLSGLSLHGINRDKSRIAPPVRAQWLEAVEITPTTHIASESIEGARHDEVLVHEVGQAVDPIDFKMWDRVNSLPSG